MNEPAATDANYENVRRIAEQTFIADYDDWLKAVTRQIERLTTQIPNESELTVLKQPLVPTELVSKLAKGCRDYAESLLSTLSAYLRLVEKRKMPTSQAVSESREHVKAVLEETRRKWGSEQESDKTPVFAGFRWLARPQWSACCIPAGVNIVSVYGPLRRCGALDSWCTFATARGSRFRPWTSQI